MASVDDIKDDQNFIDLKRHFKDLSDEIKALEIPLEDKKKIWRVATKIVIGVFDNQYENEENGDWDWDAEFFFKGDGEEREKIFQARDASVDAEGLKMFLRDNGLTKEEGKTIIREMIHSLDPNLTGGGKRKSSKSRRRHHKKRKQHTRKH